MGRHRRYDSALEACARGKMWEEYDPTPMTREWLKINGYIKD